MILFAGGGGLPSGDLIFIGRVDNQVKIRGFRIELEEIELALDAHPTIRGAALAVLHDGTAGTKRLAAYLMPFPGQDLPSVPEIRTFIEIKLPAYMVPSVFYQVENFPLSSTGKVDRRALLKLKGQALHNPSANGSPRTELERQLCKVWSDRIHLPEAEIGVEDDFFVLGGDSLTGVRILMDLKQKVGIELPMKALFEHATIKDLAAHISSSEPSTSFEIPRWDGNGTLPLSPYQEQIWLHQQLALEVPFYNEPLSISMNEAIDIACLKKALAYILQRHEALRSRFELIKGVPGQRFPDLSEGEIGEFSYFDLRHLPTQKAVEKALSLATDQAKRPFNLVNEQPIRFCLVRLQPELFRLYLAAHHLVIDGVAIYQVFLPELESAYRSLVAKQQPDITPLKVRYSDWAAWVHQGQQHQWEEDKVYWSEKLKGLNALQLPTDKAVPNEATFAGARYCLSFPPDLTQQVRKLAQKNGATLFMTMLAAFKVLLYRYTQQRDLAVGSVVANRNIPGTEQMAADFVNTLLLRTVLPKEGTFLEVLSEVRETCLDAFAHQTIPFGQVIQTINSENNDSDWDQIQVAFVLEPAISQSPGGWELSQLDIHTDSAKFDLTIELDERENNIIGRVEYRTDLYEEATIARLIQHYKVLLQAITASPDKPYAQLSLLKEEEKQQMLIDWNDNQVDYEGEDGLHKIIEKQVDRTPEATAVIFEGETLSYSELDRRANQLARHLLNLGAQPDQVIGVWTDRSADHIVAILGVLKSGAAYAPFGAEDPTERVAFIAEDTGTPIIICDEDHRNRLPQGNFQVVNLDDDQKLISKEKSSRPEVQVKSEHLAYVIYTSGSTGRPKGVLIEHRQISDRSHWAKASLRLNNSDVFLHMFSLAFDASIVPTWWALNQGATVLMPTKKGMQDPQYLVELITQHQVSTICATPTVMSTLAKVISREGYTGLRNLMTGGECLSTELLHTMQELAPRVLNFYGPTEATVLATEWDDTRQMTARPPIGIGVANTRLYVLDPNQQLVPVGVPGELYIGGQGVGRGYLNRPDLNEAYFLPDPFFPEKGARVYRTGDMVRYLPSGEIDFLGRADKQIKIRGFRVELSEIENVLRKHSGVADCVVIVRKIKAGIQQLLAYYVSVIDHLSPKDTELRNFLAKKLPAHMVPDALIKLSELPLTSNGKLDTRSLPDAKIQKEEITTMVAPRTEMEKQLYSIWSAVLEIETYGIHQDFYQTGGNSLLSIQLVAQAYEAGIQFSVMDLLEHRTIARLAQYLSLVEDAANYTEDSPSYFSVDAKTSSVKTKKVSSNQLLGFSDDRDHGLAELKNGNLPALFLVHPAGGSAHCYQELAIKIGNNQAVYGLEMGKDSTDQSIQELAEKYLEAVQQKQPYGPYFLGGWSFGGIVAFEMSRQLEAKGEKVALLTLIDSILPIYPNERKILHRLSTNNAALLNLIREHLNVISDKTIHISLTDILNQKADQREAWFTRQLIQQGIFSEPIVQNFVLPFINSFQACTKLLLDYQLGQCQTDILLLRARNTSTIFDSDPGPEMPLASSLDASCGWSEVTEGKVSVQVVPGTHETMISDPHVDRVAEEIALALHLHLETKQSDTKLSVLQDLDEKQWQCFLQEASAVHFSKGDVLMQEGERGRHLMLISEGYLKVYTERHKFHEPLCIVGPDTVIGEVGFLDGRARTASISALSNGRAYLLTPEGLAALSKTDSQLGMAIMMDIARVVSHRFRAVSV